MQAMVIGWVFASFLQGVGGFGVPVAVIAPILVGLGFSPLGAVIIPSVGHGWAVTFGSLGSSFQALIAATGLPGETLAPLSALFLSISGLMVGFLVAHAVEGWVAIRRLVVPIIVLGTVMGVIHYVVAVSGLWNIAAFSGGLAGLIVSFPLAQRFRSQRTDVEGFDLRALAVALSGYAVLVLIILGVQLISPVRSFLGQIVISVEFPEVNTTQAFVTEANPSRNIPLFRHAGMLLAYSSALAYLIYRREGLYAPGAFRRIISGAVRRVMSSSVSIASMVAMAVIMENVGMTDTLARGLAQSISAAFPLVAPWIGALGSFMTGSNTNSNVVFGALQMRTAQLLGYRVALILAGQTAGAALASVMAPTKVVVGASTAGMAGREGEVMRKLVVYTGLLVFLVSVLTVVGVWLSF